MLVGLSVSKCIADIMDDKVKASDVLLIIGRTDFNLDTIDNLISEYQSYRSDWYNYNHDDLKDLLILMFKTGRIHQPRQFGVFAQPAARGKHWLRVLHEPQDLPASTQRAWDNYVLLAGLTAKNNEFSD